MRGQPHVRFRKHAHEAARRVAARRKHVARLGQQLGMALAPLRDVHAAGRGRLRHAMRALAMAFFAAVAVGLVGQRDLRAHAVEIVRGEIPADPQLRAQLQDFVPVPEQVVIVDVRDPQCAQHLQQHFPLARQRELQPEAGARFDQLEPNCAARDRGEGEERRALIQVLRQLARMAQRAAATVVQHRQHAGQVAGADPRHVDRQPRDTRRVGGDEGMHDAVVTRVQPAQLLHRFALPRALAVAETHAAGVQHEGVQRMQVAPAGLGGAAAEIVLLAVALAEVLHIEQADRLQAIAADVHAEADPGRHVDHLSGVGHCEQRIQAGGIAMRRQLVRLAEARIAADRCVVGKRSNGGDACIAVCGLAQPVEPVVGDFGIAVEQQDVMLVADRHRAIHRCDEAQVFRILQQQDARVARGNLPQPGGDLRLGAGVVDDHQPPRRRALAGEHGFNAMARVFQALVHGHDHVHRGHARLNRLRLALAQRGLRRTLSQPSFNRHLGLDQGPRGTEHRGALDPAQVSGQGFIHSSQVGLVDLERELLARQQVFLVAQACVALLQQLHPRGQVQLQTVQGFGTGLLLHQSSLREFGLPDGFDSPLLGLRAYGLRLRVRLLPGRCLRLDRLDADAFQLLLQRLHQIGQRQVVGRHRPAQFDLEDDRIRAGASLQRVLRNGQHEARVLAMQQDQRHRRRPGRAQQHVMVLGGLQGFQPVGLAAPLPHDLGVHQQGDAVQL